MRKLFFVVLLLGLFFGSCHNRSGDDSKKLLKKL